MYSIDILYDGRRIGTLRFGVAAARGRGVYSGIGVTLYSQAHTPQYIASQTRAYVDKSQMWGLVYRNLLVIEALNE